MRALSPSRTIFISLAAGVAVFLVCDHFLSRPRVLAVSEVPVAFWAWRTAAPSDNEVQKGLAAVNGKTLFLRAGQLDAADDTLLRIRPVTGKLPRTAELHLVYNGTRRFLRQWDAIEPPAIAVKVAETYRSDLARAAVDGANVVGVQLDLDVPTRLLPKYTEVLRRLRELIPPEASLSITGLPTWTTSGEIGNVLNVVDFWIPQCYGATIPVRSNDRSPISSPESVSRTIDLVRQIGKPFYAGLAAYSYAILYGKDGELIELRGDMDPSAAAQNADLEMLETQDFGRDGSAGDVRYVYRAKGDVVLDGLIVEKGEMLVFDIPNAAALQKSARAVRENAGGRLLGICLFRLPTAEDAATLSADEIAAALADIKTLVNTAVTLETAPGNRLTLNARNGGSATAGLTADALTIDIRIPSGTIGGVTAVEGFTALETLCGRDELQQPRPCSERRADVIRLKANSWRPSTSASVTFVARSLLPATLPAIVTTLVDDGRIVRETKTIWINGEGK